MLFLKTMPQVRGYETEQLFAGDALTVAILI